MCVSLSTPPPSVTLSLPLCFIGHHKTLSFRGDNKNCGPGNVILFPGIGSRSSGSHACQTNDSLGNKNNSYIGNKCVTQDGVFYSFNSDSLDPAQIPTTRNNRFYSPGAKFEYHGKGLAELQALGIDSGSSVAEMPSIQEMMAMAQAALGFSP